MVLTWQTDSLDLKNTAEDDARSPTVALTKQLVWFFALQGWLTRDMVELRMWLNRIMRATTDSASPSIGMSPV
jgi:hypothetical protein